MVRKYQYFCRFELENMSIYEILPAQFQAVYMGFLNYNIIFDIDISNYETDYTKIRHDF
jgi:hypothetical protein